MTPSDVKLGLTQTEHYTDVLNLTYSAEVEKLYQDDAVWIITSSFIIFTMHSGFGLLESGSVSAKDEVNIMVKNVVDVVFGGLSYWAIGYGLSYGNTEALRNPFIGFGRFFYDPTRSDEQTHKEGWAYASFLFQLSFATTASTIVSGAVAERAKFKSYILLGCLVILVQALPAHWIWDHDGFFFSLGVVDFAGCCAVHMVGGVIGLIATIYLKPRRNRFNEDSIHQMSSPTNALLGTFMLWWGWFGINAGSVWGITDGRWRLGARAAVATIMSSIGGGATSIVVSFIKTRKLQVNYLIDGLLSSIVSITAMCAVARPWHALIIGSVSSAISISILPILERLKIDDPVGIVPIHLTSSIWGMFAVGIFAEDDQLIRATYGQYGLIYSGSFRLLGIQMLCSLTVIVYSAVFGLAVLVGIDKSPLGLRVTDYEEQIGADVIEHGLAGTNVARYHIEKPLSSKTFATVTKAITKWKLQTKAHSRAMRQQNLQQRIKERKAERQLQQYSTNCINTTIVDTKHTAPGNGNQTEIISNNRTNHFKRHRQTITTTNTAAQHSSQKNGRLANGNVAHANNKYHNNNNSNTHNDNGDNVRTNIANTNGIIARQMRYLCNNNSNLSKPVQTFSTRIRFPSSPLSASGVAIQKTNNIISNNNNNNNNNNNVLSQSVQLAVASSPRQSVNKLTSSDISTKSYYSPPQTPRCRHSESGSNNNNSNSNNNGNNNNVGNISDGGNTSNNNGDVENRRQKYWSSVSFNIASVDNDDQRCTYHATTTLTPLATNSSRIGGEDADHNDTGGDISNMALALAEFRTVSVAEREEIEEQVDAGIVGADCDEHESLKQCDTSKNTRSVVINSAKLPPTSTLTQNANNSSSVLSKTYSSSSSSINDSMTSNTSSIVSSFMKTNKVTPFHPKKQQSYPDKRIGKQTSKH